MTLSTVISKSLWKSGNFHLKKKSISHTETNSVHRVRMNKNNSDFCICDYSDPSESFLLMLMPCEGTATFQGGVQINKSATLPFRQGDLKA